MGMGSVDALLILLFILFAAVIPTLIYVVVAYWLDRYEKEPLWLLVVTFLWGAIPAIVLSLIFELVLDIPVRVLVTGAGADLVSTVLTAPVIEEMAKAVPLLGIFLLYRYEFDGLMDGLIYGALVGFGFAMTENIFYYLAASTVGMGELFLLIVLRGIVFGMNHALFASVTGIGLAYARYTHNRRQGVLAFLAGLAGAIALHMAHNFFVSLDSLGLFLTGLLVDWVGVLVWLVLVVWALRVERRWITEELAEEVAFGLLPAHHATAAASYRTRLRERWAAWREHGVGRAHRLSDLHNAAAKLGVLKRQLRRHPASTRDLAQLKSLRDRVWQMQAALEE